MICQNIGLSVRNSSRIDKLNFKFLLTVNMYLNMLMIAYRLISIEEKRKYSFLNRPSFKVLSLFRDAFLSFSVNLSLLIE